MKREILFRGKTANPNGLPNHESYWVYGLLGGSGIKEFPYLIDRCFIIPETIGQFTGLTDKNGVKIFEGDIVSKSKKTFKVDWNHLHACWGLFSNSRQSSYNILCDMYDTKGKITKCWQDSSLCIIGNNHDNPELLK